MKPSFRKAGSPASHILVFPALRRAAIPMILLATTALAGCATTSAKPPAIAYDDPPREIAATPAAEPPRPVEVVTIPEPLPLPGQLKPVAAGAATCSKSTSAEW